MALLFAFGGLVFGFILLVLCGNSLVRGSIALAKLWGIPPLIVGSTIIAFGTSAPELFVSVQAVINEAGKLAAGNIIGSNIANVFLALGMPALIKAIPTNTPGVKPNSLIALGATILFIFLVFIHNPLLPWQGAILLFTIFIYLGWSIWKAKMGAGNLLTLEIEDSYKQSPRVNGYFSATMIILGCIGLAIAADIIVHNATQIAAISGVGETLIGLTIVAIGTSLPEIVTVIIAAYHGHSEVALGNVLGSNIFNLLAVAGTSALFGPVQLTLPLLIFDIWIMLAASLMMLMFILIRHPIGRSTGAIFLAGYIFYITALIRTII